MDMDEEVGLCSSGIRGLVPEVESNVAAYESLEAINLNTLTKTF